MDGSITNISPWIQAVCWTLFHSLWQGLVFALLAAGLLYLIPKNKAVFRYNLLLVFFMLFVIAVCGSLLLELAAIQNKDITTYVDLTASLIYRTDDPREVSPLFTAFVRYFNLISPALFTIIFLIWVYKVRQIFLQWRLSNQLAGTGVPVANPDLQDWLYMQVKKLRINRPVLLLESLHVISPVLIGFFKPVILLPVGLVNRLTLEETENILLHELAHIKRWDYLVNMFQIFTELVFFFNPGLLWLSAQLRREREHCCDDQAIHLSRDRNSYIRTLVSVYEYSHAQSSVFLGFSGSGQMIHRVNRLVDGNHRTIIFWPVICIFSMVALLVLLSKEFKGNPAAGVPTAYVNTSKDLYFHSFACRDTSLHPRCQSIQQQLRQLSALPLDTFYRQITADLIRSGEINPLRRLTIEINSQEMIINGVMRVNWVSSLLRDKYLTKEKQTIVFSIP